MKVSLLPYPAEPAFQDDYIDYNFKRIADFLNQDDPWHVVGAPGQPAFQGTWLDVGGTYIPTRFCKLSGIVYLEIAAKGGNINSQVFVLPAGYRPIGDLRTPALINDGGISYPAMLYLASTGSVEAYQISAGATNPLDYFLIVTSFPADQ